MTYPLHNRRRCVYRYARGVLAIVAAMCLGTGGATAAELDARWQRDTDDRPIPLPEERPFIGRWWDFADHSVFRQLQRMIDIPQIGRSLGSAIGVVEPEPAWNVNAWDEVPDSAWFTNRIARRVPTPDEVAQGGRIAPPRTDAPWRVIRGKPDGVTPGFVVRDADDRLYFVKFDAAAHDGLGTGADVIGALLLHAAGYWVTENYVVDLDLRHIQLDPEATKTGEYKNEKVPMRYADLRELLSRANIRPDGTVRVVASAALPGRPVGTFAYEGRRGDDPNDRIPHQHRRELRAYYVFASWINDTDIQEANTLDTYMGEPGRGYIRHNLLDFSSGLGASGSGSKLPHTGYAHILDYGTIGANLVTLGFRREPWEGIDFSPYPEVGMFEASHFEPNGWRPRMPNPAFERMTDLDAYWAARIIVRFSDAHLEAIVAEAQYPDPEAAAYVTRTLAARRDAIVRHWFGRVAPLDDFTLSRDDAGWRLRVRDLAVDYGYAETETRRYRLWWRGVGRRGHTLTAAELAAGVALPATDDSLQLAVYDGERRVGNPVRVRWVCGAETCAIAGIER